MSETILSISRASAHSKFLKDFYSFTTIFNTGELDLIIDNTKWQDYDVAMLTNIEGTSGVVIWVVDRDTMKLSWSWGASKHHESVLGYRGLSWSEIIAIGSDPNVVYDYVFSGDKVFPNFYLQDYQVQMFNGWENMVMDLSIFPKYKEDLHGELWSSLPQDEVFYYSLTF